MPQFKTKDEEELFRILSAIVIQNGGSIKIQDIAYRAAKDLDTPLYRSSELGAFTLAHLTKATEYATEIIKEEDRSYEEEIFNS